MQNTASQLSLCAKASADRLQWKRLELRHRRRRWGGLDWLGFCVNLFRLVCPVCGAVGSLVRRWSIWRIGREHYRRVKDRRFRRICNQCCKSSPAQCPPTA